MTNFDELRTMAADKRDRNLKAARDEYRKSIEEMLPEKPKTSIKPLTQDEIAHILSFYDLQPKQAGNQKLLPT